MRERMTKVVFMSFMTLLLVVLPLISACGGDDEEQTPRPAEDEIVIGWSISLSGPAASSMGPRFSDALGVFDYINDVLGGIEGFKFRVVWGDNKYDAATSVIVFKELREKHHPMMWWAWDDFAYSGVKDILEQDKTPVYAQAALSPQLFGEPGMLFSFMGCDANLFTGAVRWILQDWEASGGTGRPKLGTLHWDMPWGNGHKIGDTYKWAEEHGVDVVERTFAPMALDLRPQLMGLRDEGVDYIWFGAVTSDTALVIRDAKALGLWEEVKFIRGYSGESFDLLGVVGEEAEGLYEVTDTEPVSSGVEAASYSHAVSEWIRGKARPSDFPSTAALVNIFKSVIRQAIDDVGRENINGEALYNAFQKIENVSTLGAFHDLSWGPERRLANRFMKVKQYTKTGTVAISDWIPMDDVFEKEARGKEGWPSAD